MYMHALCLQDFTDEARASLGINSARIVNLGEALVWVCSPSNPFIFLHRRNKKTKMETLQFTACKSRLSFEVSSPLPSPALHNGSFFFP